MRGYDWMEDFFDPAPIRPLSLRGRRIGAVMLIVFIGTLTPPRPAPAFLGHRGPVERPVVNKSSAVKSAPAHRHARAACVSTTPLPPTTAPPAPASMPAPAAAPLDQTGAAAQSVSTPSKLPARVIAGWLPYWDIAEGARIINEFPNALNEVSPFWYEVADDGQVKNSPGAENTDLLRLLRERGIRTIPTIMSANQESVSGMINDPVKRKAHIRQITKKIDAFGYDGIDIDYENLPSADRNAFSNFIRKLAKAVHKRGKILVVTVNSKTSEPGTWSGAQSHDYAALGAAADMVRVMAYDQHYSGGPPGPVAAIDWVERVITFTLSKVPKEKFVLGVPAYGYDWPSQGRGKSVVHDEVAAKSLSNQAPVQWDARSASSFFNYNDGSGPRTVWFENRRSLDAKADLVNKFDLAGVAIWRLGREDKTAYLNLKAKLNGP